MRLTRIRLRQFRNIAAANLDFSGCRQFFHGGNGQGKTNLLEAVGFVTALRSFRANDHRNLILHGAPEASVSCLFEHEITGPTPILIRIRPEGRVVMVDQEKILRVGDLIGRFPTVVLSSDDIRFIRYSPGFRRRWMDLVFAAADPHYLHSLQRFHRGLAERNKVLQMGGSDLELEAFEETMAGAAEILVDCRARGTKWLQEKVREIHSWISEGKETAGLRYECGGGGTGVPSWRSLWRESRAKDRLAGRTRRGPHRHDYLLSLNGRPSGDYGSEGQQRGLVLALRLAQFHFFQDRSGVSPVLLADDIVNELDPDRRRRFWESLGGETQVLATGTEPPPEAGSWQVFRVADGSFSPA